MACEPKISKFSLGYCIWNNNNSKYLCNTFHQYLLAPRTQLTVPKSTFKASTVNIKIQHQPEQELEYKEYATNGRSSNEVREVI